MLLKSPVYGHFWKIAPIFVILPENLNFAGIFARKLEFSPVFLLKMARIFPKKGPYEEVTLKLGHPNCWDGGGQNFQKNCYASPIVFEKLWTNCTRFIAYNIGSSFTLFPGNFDNNSARK